MKQRRSDEELVWTVPSCCSRRTVSGPRKPIFGSENFSPGKLRSQMEGLTFVLSVQNDCRLSSFACVSTIENLIKPYLDESIIYYFLL